MEFRNVFTEEERRKIGQLSSTLQKSKDNKEKEETLQQMQEIFKIAEARFFGRDK